jgi:regulator of replication initiation timing
MNTSDRDLMLMHGLSMEQVTEVRIMTGEIMDEWVTDGAISNAIGNAAKKAAGRAASAAGGLKDKVKNKLKERDALNKDNKKNKPRIVAQAEVDKAREKLADWQAKLEEANKKLTASQTADA